MENEFSTSAARMQSKSDPISCNANIFLGEYIKHKCNFGYSIKVVEKTTVGYRCLGYDLEDCLCTVTGFFFL